VGVTVTDGVIVIEGVTVGVVVGVMVGVGVGDTMGTQRIYFDLSVLPPGVAEGSGEKLPVPR
jgi:hypothetical protein